MKPRIFIGSSTESLEIAYRVKSFFSKDYDCFLWTDGIFKSNESFVETLIKSASLFDFGIMVFAKDDTADVRKKACDITRDNMLFEYGLFLGRVGADRAFVLAEDGVRIPTDLTGITHVFYNTQTNSKGTRTPTSDFDRKLSVLKKQMDENINIGYLGLLPSTALAISYFDNFVKLIANWIVGGKPAISLDGKEFINARLYIKLPDSLDADIKGSATVFYKNKGLRNSRIKTSHREYPIHFEAKESQENLEIYDMPTILCGLNRTMDMYFKKGFIGKKPEQQLAEDYEMGNFRRVLKILVNGDAMCRECVEIID